MNNPVYKWAQVLNRQLTKRIYWQRSTERDVNITLSRNYKVKQWDTTAHLLERLKSKKKKNAGENVKQEKTSFIVGGNEKRSATLEGKICQDLTKQSILLPTIQQWHSLVFIQRRGILTSTQKPIHRCL